ncbi:MAG TPA: CpaF family protein [Vicinamibacterales bacterium]|jgi:pilus assembly protein CpaF|nr:CpaF family protein [Vicinamibacterales bacterium]
MATPAPTAPLSTQPQAAARPAPRPGAGPAPRQQYLELRANVHRKLLNRLNLEALARADRARAESEIRALMSQLLAEEPTPLNIGEREQLFAEVVDDVFGLGPLEPLLRDPSVSDILVNTAQNVFVERKGKMERVTASFQDNAHLMRVIDRIVSRVGRRVDDSSPMVDARLPDGSRVNAIIPPLAVDGPLLSIRRFPAERLKANDLVTLGALTAPMLEFLSHCVRSKLNCLISGGTGAGKTTLLNVLSSYISEDERIVTIEDAAELQLHQEHVARLETRPANVEGKGAIRQRQLVVNALRMRPDRIVIGEVRGEEALDMLQAMNTGHDGSLTTVHANTPRDALTRVETMIAMGSTNLPEKAMRHQIASAIQIVMQQTRLSDGTRKVTSISEITGMEGDIITMQEIFVFEKLGVGQEGRVIGRFRATGVRPKVAERLLAAGIQLPASMFEGVVEVR